MDVGVGLDSHELIHLDRAWLAHPAEVIALEVDQHDVFRPLLRMRGKSRHLRNIVPGPTAARSSSTNGPGVDAASLDPNQTLRRRTEDRHAAPLRKGRKRR